MGRRREAIWGASAAVAAFVVFTVAAAFACVPGMDVSITPVSGLPGTKVEVTGVLFPPGGGVEVRLDNATPLCDGTVPASGTFTCSFTIPDVAPGTHVVGANVTNADGSPHPPQLNATLTIPGATTTSTAAPTTTTPTTSPQQGGGSGTGSGNSTTTTAAPSSRAATQTNTAAPAAATPAASAAATTPKAGAPAAAAPAATVAPVPGLPTSAPTVDGGGSGNDGFSIADAEPADAELAAPSSAASESSGGLNPLLVLLLLGLGAGAVVLVRRRRTVRL